MTVKQNQHHAVKEVHLHDLSIMTMLRSILFSASLLPSITGFHLMRSESRIRASALICKAHNHDTTLPSTSSNNSQRRAFLVTTVAALVSSSTLVGSAEAVGPIKVSMKPMKYTAKDCPPSKPIPGQQAMKGMRGLCVTVDAELLESPPKDMEKVGVYGFVRDEETGDSVLANNPDLNTDAGQFAMIESIKTSDKNIRFEFIAAVPKDRDLSQFANGIGPLSFESLRVISYPGGQQFGAISPCEMNEFSDECEAWEAENGPYERGAFMMKSKANRD